jgi:hypothetical protein
MVVLGKRDLVAAIEQGMQHGGEAVSGSGAVGSVTFSLAAVASQMPRVWVCGEYGHGYSRLDVADGVCCLAGDEETTRSDDLRVRMLGKVRRANEGGGSEAEYGKCWATGSDVI